METSSPFGVALAAARDAANMTQAQLAFVLSVSPSTVWRLETGRTGTPHRALLHKIVKALPAMRGFLDDAAKKAG